MAQGVYSQTIDLTSKRNKRVFSPLSFVAEVSRYLNRGPLDIEEILDSTQEGIDELVAMANEFNELLYDEIIPRLFNLLYELDESEQTEEHEVDLIKIPQKGYYEISLQKIRSSVGTMSDSKMKNEPKVFTLTLTASTRVLKTGYSGISYVSSGSKKSISPGC